MKKNNFFLFIFLLLLLISIIISPAKFISAGLDGISAWAFSVLPSVLPFMIISSLLLSTGYIEKACKPFERPFKKIYNTNAYSAYVFFVSIISGYPVGSKMIAELYEQNKISRSDAFRMSSFCSNSGPMFIVGAVGIKMILSSLAGYIMLISHIIGAILNGILYRKIAVKDETNQFKIQKKSPPTFSEIIESSCKNILIVGTIIAFFFIVIEFLSIPFSFLNINAQSVLFGFVEITKGCLMIASNFGLKLATILCTIVITFGGISTILQSIALLNRTKMPVKLFALQKFTQALLSGIIALVLSNILL